MRAVQGWGIDLSLFQFHGQLTWAVFFLNPDRTIYGRYGSRAPSGTSGFKGNDRFVTMEGFKKAIQGALELHAAYPANKASLAGKTGPAPIAKTPEAIPAASAWPVRRVDGTDRNKGCVHCHEVQDWEFIEARKKGAVADRFLWTYPMPDTLGLSLHPDERATAAGVAPGSAAAKAGFKAGDRLLALDGQPLLSIADVQWVLHQAPEPGVVKGEVERAGKKAAVSLELKAGWRRTYSFADNLSLGWMSRQRTAGFRLEPVPQNDRDKLGLGADTPALRILNLAPEFGKERNTSPKQAGLLKGDVLLELDGRPIPAPESEYLAYLLQKKKPGDKIKLGYRRGGGPLQTVEVETR